MRKIALGPLSLIVCALLPAWTAPALGAPLGPRKPSDLRTILGIATPCPGPPAILLDQQQNGDGTEEAFSIPAGMVLVVTSYDVFVRFIAAGSSDFTLFVVNGAGDNSRLALGSIIAPTAGDFMTSGTIPHGAVVKSGSSLCFAKDGGGSTNVLVRGFLTKDK